MRQLLKVLLLTFSLNWLFVFLYRLSFGQTFWMTPEEHTMFPGNTLNLFYKWIPGLVAIAFCYKESIKLSYFKTRLKPALLSVFIGILLPLTSFVLSLSYTSSTFSSFSLSSLTLLLVWILPYNLFIALGEEVLWRGYFLEKCRTLSFIKLSLFQGVTWGLWHLPLITIGFDYPGHPFVGTTLMLTLTVSMTPLFIYLRMQGGSLLAPTLLHGLFNTFGVYLLSLLAAPTLVVGSFGLIGALVTVPCFWLGLKKLQSTYSTGPKTAIAEVLFDSSQ